jgi:glycosyltransferase involved in cell wall biosynthesis
VRLAVLIPAHDAGADLQRTLRSLADDSFPFDVIVVDDGSRPPLDVPRTAGCHAVVTLRHDRNRGVAHALNTGIDWIVSHGYDALARLDAGDMNEAGRLAAQVAFLEAHDEMAIVGAWTRQVDERLTPLYETKYPVSADGIRRCFHYRTAFSHPACMIRTAVLRRDGGYDPRYTFAEDYELFWRLALRYPCANLPRVLVTRVEHARSVTRANRFAAARMRLRLQWQHFTWTHLDCWLGLVRSLGLLCVPARIALTIKRAAGSVG